MKRPISLPQWLVVAMIGLLLINSALLLGWAFLWH